MPQLLNDLRQYPGTYSCYSFGSVHHLTLKSPSPVVLDHLTAFLESRGHVHLLIEQAPPNIEDVFIELMGKVA